MKNIKHILPLLLVSVLFTGCLNDLFEQNDNTFQGTQVEFSPLTGAIAEPRTGVAPVVRNVNVNLIGAQRDSDTPISFTVAGTADAGVHYNILTPSPIVLPANSSSVNVQVQVIDSPLANNVTQTVVLELQSGDVAEAAENLKTFTLTIVGRP